MCCEYDTLRCRKTFCILCRTELQCQEESVTNLCRQCEFETKMCFGSSECCERCETSSERCETSSCNDFIIDDACCETSSCNERCETSSCDDFIIDDAWLEIPSSGINKQNRAIDFTSREKSSQLIFYHPADDSSIFLKSSNGQNLYSKIGGCALNYEISCKNKLVCEKYLNNIQQKSPLCSNLSQKNRQINKSEYFYQLETEKKFKSLLFITHFLILVSANSLYSKMAKFLSNEDFNRNKMNANKKKIVRGRADEPSMLKLLMLAFVLCVSHVDAFRGESLIFSDEI